MAHLGAIDMIIDEGGEILSAAHWWGADPRDTSVPMNRVFSGVVSDGPAPVAGAVVTLFHRKSKMPIDQTKADAAGAFTFLNLPPAPWSDYFAVAMWENNGAVNSLIIDRIQPVLP